MDGIRRGLEGDAVASLRISGELLEGHHRSLNLRVDFGGRIASRECGEDCDEAHRTLLEWNGRQRGRMRGLTPCRCIG